MFSIWNNEVVLAFSLNKNSSREIRTLTDVETQRQKVKMTDFISCSSEQKHY